MRNPSRKVPSMRAVYPSFLREAVHHAERLVGVLESLDPRAVDREAASTWPN